MDLLDYVVTYPNGSTGQFNCEEFQNFKEQFSHIPVVILFGWAGCEDKYLAKYSDIFERKGYISLRYIASLSSIVHRRRTLRPIAKKLALLLKNITTDTQPIFFHIFSNGGASVYQQLSRLIVKEDGSSMFNIRGCIFDSCPTDVSSLTGAKAAMAIVRYNVVLKWIVGIILLLFYVIREIIDSIRLCIQEDDTSRSRMYPLLKEEPSTWPQLFLYSKADKICDYKNIQAFHEYREKLGVPVKFFCWDDSAHVDHLRTHREMYINEITHFIFYCMPEKNT